jgi:NAD(P)-dependent dehydrogenase (short-subunit alcohol dehydrogenase family)
VNKNLQNKIALLTGADGGLGTHVTRVLLDSGATVIGVSRKVQPPRSDTASFIALAADLSSAETAKKTVDEIAGRFGRLDILAHLLGGFAGGKTIAETDDATFQRMLDLNLNSAFYVLRAVIPHMRRAGSGRIISVALENKDLAITANVLLPGTMDTPANRQAMPGADTSKWVQPASVASLIAWLTSEAGKDVNGAVIPVYGGGL